MTTPRPLTATPAASSSHQPGREPAGPSGYAARRVLSILGHQIRYNLLSFRRSRQGGFFTVLFPVIFLVVFVTVFGNDVVLGPGGPVKASTYYVPGVAALAIVTTSFANLVVSVVNSRESGILRRRRATPVPAAVLVAAQTLTVLVVSLVVVAVLLLVGRLAYGVTLHPQALPTMLLTVAVGSVCCTSLGYAMATAIGSVEAATPIVQAITLPLYFVSGVFVPASQLPSWMQHLASVFPVQHLASGLRHAFDPRVAATTPPWTDLAVLAVWAAIGLSIAIYRFSWSKR